MQLETARQWEAGAYVEGFVFIAQNHMKKIFNSFLSRRIMNYWSIAFDHIKTHLITLKTSRYQYKFSALNAYVTLVAGTVVVSRRRRPVSNGNHWEVIAVVYSIYK